MYKRKITSTKRYAEESQRAYDHFLLWLTNTNTYLGTVCENHSWLSTVPSDTLATLKKVSAMTILLRVFIAMSVKSL